MREFAIRMKNIKATWTNEAAFKNKTHCESGLPCAEEFQELDWALLALGILI